MFVVKKISFLLTLSFWGTLYALSAPQPTPPGPPLVGNLAFSPNDVVIWTGIRATSYDDGYTVVKVYLETKENFSIYKSKLKIFPGEGSFFSHLIAPIAEATTDPLTKELTHVYKGGEFSLIFQNLLPQKESSFNFSLQYVGCSSKICLFPYKEKITAPHDSLRGFIPEEFKKKTTKETSARPTHPTLLHESKSSDEEQTSLFAFNENSFKQKMKTNTSFGSSLLFLLFLLLAGLATNFTPCVYPMIPITIRILAKQKTSPLLASSAYSLGIMITYTTLAIVAIASGSMFGNVSSNPYLNLFLALVMFYFGMSMLGYGNYSFLQRLGHKFSSKEHGLKSAFIMGSGAGLLASPCTGPILGSLLAYSATKTQAPYITVLYFLTYSFGFSLPYILLGKASSRLVQVKFRSSIQQITKTIFAGIMFGLFFYYLRIPFYSLHKALSPYWLEILVISFTSFLLLHTISCFRRPLKSLKIHAIILLGLFFFSSFQWLNQSTENESIHWNFKEKEALNLGLALKKPVLIDMWAEWCEVCKKMDKTTFSDPKVQQYLKDKEWVLLRLDLTENNAQTEAIYKKYNLVGLPSLVLVPEGKLENMVLLKGQMTAQKLLEVLHKYSKG